MCTEVGYVGRVRGVGRVRDVRRVRGVHRVRGVGRVRGGYTVRGVGRVRDVHRVRVCTRLRCAGRVGGAVVPRLQLQKGGFYPFVPKSEGAKKRFQEPQACYSHRKRVAHRRWWP